jgi:beta-lactamase regulating signal transducer with metallopeptidase domain
MSFDSFIPVIAANLVWQTLLVALVVFIVLKVLPRQEARTRYRIALTALLGTSLLLIAPFLPNYLPEIALGVQPMPVQEFSPVIADTVSPAATIEPTAMYAETSDPFPVGTILLIIWAIGSALAVARLCLAGLQGRRWVQRSKRVDVHAQDLSKPVQIRSSADANAPLVLGLLRPVILVPPTFNLDLSNIESRAVIEHEIAHIERQDLIVNLGQQVILAALWWCAPLYWVNKQIMIEREKLCDDIAARKTGAGHALARALVNLAESHSACRPPLLAIGLHPKAGALAERIQRLCLNIYKETSMPTISKKLMLSTTLAAPLVLAALVLAAPRAIAHSPFMSHSAGHSGMEDISSLQYALLMAASEGRVDEARQLLGMGVDPVFHLQGDGSPLILAAKHGHVEMAQLLVAHGAQVNRMTASDESPLINAVKGGHLRMVEYLVSQGADVSLGQVSNPMNRPEWRSPLSTAQKYRHVEIAQYLQNQGAVADTRKQSPRRIAPGPIVEGKLTSTFGVMRKTSGGEKHKGIDIANAEGTPIYAPADGTITEVTSNYKGKPKWGHVVVLQTPGGVETVFAHLKDSQVSAGDFVRQGTQIARVGNTGQSTGPHVHIQTSKNGELKDPLKVWPTLAR